MTVIYPARRIITLDPARPFVTHVAVRDGRILGAGSAEDMACFIDAEWDHSLADKVLMPGFVEGHSHCDIGAFEHMVPIGAYERMTPDGNVWPGLSSVDAALARLREWTANHNDEVVIGWSFDPLHVDRDLTRHDLDTVSTNRPVVVSHSSGGHVIYMNTVAMLRTGLFPPPGPHDGIVLGDDGLPSGRIAGPEIVVPAATKLGIIQYFMGASPALVRSFARNCVRAGVTTATELALILDDENIAVLAENLSGGLPVRLCAAIFSDSRADVERTRKLQACNNEFFRIGAIKLVVDGSIQGFTARISWPGYHNGSPNGLWYIAPEQLEAIMVEALARGVQAHIHTNGNEAIALALDCMERALRHTPAFDHRFTLQHAQLMDRAQMRRAKALGMGVNLFANHLYYFGDVHHSVTVGPERAAGMNACRSALDEGLPLAIHSDDPVTPMAPLVTAWCAVNRRTSGGRVLGPDERISIPEALHAITLGAAWTLRMDHEVGSIENGKRADFAVLNEDPLTVGDDGLADIGVWGTVLGGVVQSAVDA